VLPTKSWPPKAILVSDWLISKKSSSLKLLNQMNRNLVGSILGGSSIKNAHFTLICLAKWFQRKRFLEIDQSKIRIACGGHVC
jgi:hypothetical protein